MPEQIQVDEHLLAEAGRGDPQALAELDPRQSYYLSNTATSPNFDGPCPANQFQARPLRTGAWCITQLAQRPDHR